MASARWPIAHRLLAPVQGPDRPGQTRQQSGVARRVLHRIELAQRLSDQHLTAGPVPGHPVGTGSPAEQIHVVKPDQRLRLRDARPELQRPLDQIGGLAVGLDALGGERGGDRAAQRRRLVPRGRVVAGHRGCSLELTLVAVAARPLQVARQREMKLTALAGQQVVVEGLAQQRMAELKALVRARDEQLLGHRLAKRELEALAVQLSDR